MNKKQRQDIMDRDLKLVPNMSWTGSESKCDVCAQPFKKYFIDGVHECGKWLLMCEICFVSQGLGLGLGIGQVYDTKTRQKLNYNI